MHVVVSVGALCLRLAAATSASSPHNNAPADALDAQAFWPAAVRTKPMPPSPRRRDTGLPPRPPPLSSRLTTRPPPPSSQPSPSLTQSSAADWFASSQLPTYLPGNKGDGLGNGGGLGKGTGLSKSHGGIGSDSLSESGEPSPAPPNPPPPSPPPTSPWPPLPPLLPPTNREVGEPDAGSGGDVPSSKSIPPLDQPTDTKSRATPTSTPNGTWQLAITISISLAAATCCIGIAGTCFIEHRHWRRAQIYVETRNAHRRRRKEHNARRLPQLAEFMLAFGQRMINCASHRSSLNPADEHVCAAEEWYISFTNNVDSSDSSSDITIQAEQRDANIDLMSAQALRQANAFNVPARRAELAKEFHQLDTSSSSWWPSCFVIWPWSWKDGIKASAV